VRAIGGCGNDVEVSFNTVYNAVMENVDSTSSSGWSQAVSCDSCGATPLVLSTNWLFNNNLIYNSWGEGIDCIQVIGCTVRSNIVYDTFSVNIYMDNAQNILVDSNYVYSSNSKYYRNGRPATGILVGAEAWPAPNQPLVTTQNVTIQNNLLVGTNGLANYQEDPNYVTDVHIYYNTVWNSYKGNSFYWPVQPTMPSNLILRDNIFWAVNDWSCSIPGQNSAWSFSSNVWVGTQKIPINCTDNIGSASPSVLVTNYTNIYFAGGQINVAGADADNFVLAANSPARGVATPISGITVDYYGYPRSSATPSAGFTEYGTIPTPGDGANFDGSSDGSAAVSLAPASFMTRLLLCL